EQMLLNGALVSFPETTIEILSLIGVLARFGVVKFGGFCEVCLENIESFGDLQAHPFGLRRIEKTCAIGIPEDAAGGRVVAGTLGEIAQLVVEDQIVREDNDLA